MTSSKTSALVLSLAALALSACSGVSPAGMIAARNLDPLGTDPASIAVAVGVPRSVQLRDGDAEFKMSFQGTGSDVGVQREQAVMLELVPADADQIQPNDADEHVFLARIPDAETGSIAMLQNDIKQLRASGVQGQGSLAISVAGGCYTGDAPTDLTVSTWIQTGPRQRFVPLTRSQSLARNTDAATVVAVLDRLSPCKAAQSN